MDYIILTHEEEETLLHLAALKYRLEDMALFLNRPLDEFRHDAETRMCKVNHIIRRGQLQKRLEPELKLFKIATTGDGNITAIQQLAKQQRENKLDEMLEQLYGDEA